MQATMLVFARQRGDKSWSLRQRIGEDLGRDKHPELCVGWYKKAGRVRGWTSLQGRPGGPYGALKLEWDGKCGLLTVRAISKRGQKPFELMGIFVEYLLTKQRAHIANITIPVG